MNNPDNGAPGDSIRSLIERQKRLIQATKEELNASNEKLKQTLRQHDDIFYRLFPPVRPGRDSTLIEARIEESRKQLARLRQAIFDQRLELESLLQSPSKSISSTETTFSLPMTPSGSIINGEGIVDKGRDNLEKLKKEFAECRLTLDKLEALLSPIRLLPMELIGEIFNHCSGNIAYGSMSLNSGPLLMTHVCSSWRTIAINKPNLWTHICVTIESDDIKRGWPALVQLWVERSKNMPLSIRIQESETHDYRKQPHSVFFGVLDILSTRCLQWKSVELVNRHYRAQGKRQWFRNSPWADSFPVLESFHLNSRTMDADEVRWLTKMLSSSPRLHAVSWIVKAAPSRPALPWSQLSQLTLVLFSTLEEIYEIMSGSPQLQKLDVTIQTFAGMHAQAQLTHAMLRTLYISCAGNLEPAVFDSFTLPNLQDLTIDQMPETFPLEINGPWPHAALLRFFQRSKCKLQRLVLLDVVVLQDVELITLLRSLSPFLRELCIENFNYSFITDSVLEALTYPDITQETPESLGAVLCAKLEVMKLQGCIRSTDGVLADMALSRWRCQTNHPSLRRLKLGTFGVHTPPSKPLDQHLLEKLDPLTIEYKIIETY